MLATIETLCLPQEDPSLYNKKPPCHYRIIFKSFIQAVQDNDITIIPIKPDQLTVFEKLPLLHRDAAYLRYDDRLLIATAISEQMTFISADKNIAQYDVPLVW